MYLDDWYGAEKRCRVKQSASADTPDKQTKQKIINCYMNLGLQCVHAPGLKATREYNSDSFIALYILVYSTNQTIINYVGVHRKSYYTNHLLCSSL